MARRRATERIDIRSLPRALPFQKCSGLSVHRGRSDYDFHFSIDVNLCGTGRIWPVSILRTEAISGGKLPSGPNALPPHDFAPHTTLADAPRNLATRVLNASTESAQGQDRECQLLCRPFCLPPSFGHLRHGGRSCWASSAFEFMTPRNVGQGTAQQVAQYRDTFLSRYLESRHFSDQSGLQPKNLSRF